VQAFEPAMPTFEIEDLDQRILAAKKSLEPPDGAFYKSLFMLDRLVESNVASSGGKWYLGEQVSVCDLCIFDFVSFMCTGCGTP
jgi:hypothetical protein